MADNKNVFPAFRREGGSRPLFVSGLPKEMPGMGVPMRVMARLADRLAAQSAPYAKYEDKPAAFARDVLGVTLWDKQEEMCHAVLEHQRVCIKGGHGIGKTWNDAFLCIWFVASRVDSQCISTSTTFFQVRARLWAEINRMHERSRQKLPGKCGSTAWKVGAKWFAEGISTNDTDNMQGGHAGDMLILFTEAQGIESPIFLAAKVMMSNKGAHWVIDGNPTKADGDFYESFRNPLWHPISVSCWDHPNVKHELEGKPYETIPYPEAVTLGWIEECKQEWGEESPLYLSRVMAEFPEEGDNVLITINLLEQADQEDPKLDELSDTYVSAGHMKGVHMGVDIARYGTDANCAAISRDGVLIDIRTWQGMNLMETVGRIRQIAGEYDIPPENIHIDVIGLGAGVVDRLNELGWGVEGVGFAESPINEWDDIIHEVNFKNRRAELYYATARALRYKMLRIPERFKGAWRDLIAPMYFYDSTDRLFIEPKDKIKERIGRSPDIADAVVIMMSRGSSVFSVHTLEGQS